MTDEGTKEPTMERVSGNCNGRECGNLSAIDARDQLIAELREQLNRLLQTPEARDLTDAKVIIRQHEHTIAQLRESNAAKDAENERLRETIQRWRITEPEHEQIAALKQQLAEAKERSEAMLSKTYWSEYQHVKQQLAETEKESERRRQERADALNVSTTDGMTASEWVLRAGKAERSLSETVSVLDELIRLYKWRFELAAEEKWWLGAAWRGITSLAESVLDRARALHQNIGLCAEQRDAAYQRLRVWMEGK